MIRMCFLWIMLIVGNSAFATGTCSDVHGKQNFSPLPIKSGIVCFVQRRLLDDKNGMPIGLDGIVLYYIADGKAPVEAEGRGLLYDDVPGEIIDAFWLKIGRYQREKLFVIHSFQVRSSLVEPNSSGRFYSVSVFELVQNVLRQDERSTDWFGVGYGWLSDEKNNISKYPFQSRKDVLRAISSPFAQLMSDRGSIPVKVRFKAYLYSESSIRGKTKKYLIKGDRAVVEEVTAGWCKVNYVKGRKVREMWLLCSALDAHASL